jgi:glucose-6-phosphate isomerase
VSSNEQAGELLVNLDRVARDLGVKPDAVRKAFVRSLRRKRVVDYLAEMGEKKGKTVADALDKLRFPEVGLEELITALEEELEIVTRQEIEWNLPRTLDPARFVRALQERGGKGESEILAAMKKAWLELAALRYRIDGASGGPNVPFSNMAASTFEPGSEGLQFARGKIHFIGLKSPERMVNAERLELLKRYCEAVLRQTQRKPAPVFKGGIMEAHERFYDGEMVNAAELLPEVREKYGANEAGIIDGYLVDHLSKKGKTASGESREEAIAAVKSQIKSVITFGIGGNEMRWHALADFFNKQGESERKGKKWIPLHSADQVARIPPDADGNNTVRLAFSRGGNTEETKAAEEVLHGRFPASILYTNSPEWKEMGQEHDALVLPFPRRIAGRYCGLKTSLNLAPMYLLGMDTRAYWEASDRADRALDIGSELNLAWQLARFIFLEKELTGTKMIYLGRNSERLGHSLNELGQYIMEGLAKEENELFAMVGMPYLRNTHYEIEGPLGNPRFFLFWNFLLCQVRAEERFRYAHAVTEKKQKLYADQVSAALMAAALAICVRRSPGIVFLLSDESLETLAYLSKIYEDTIYLLCRLTNVDPFGNPCVKEIRGQSSQNVERLFEMPPEELRDKYLLYRLIRNVFSR